MNSPALFAQPHPHLDLDDQLFASDAHKGRLHNEWVQSHSAKTTMDHSCSRVKAILLVKEAERLEMIHLQHQKDHATFMLQRCHSNTKILGASSPSRDTPAISPPRGQLADVASSPDVPHLALNLPKVASADDSSCSPISNSKSPSTSNSISPSRRAARDSFTSTHQEDGSSSSNNANAISKKHHQSHHKRSSSCPPPPSPVACGCLHVAAWRLMTPRCRVMALLKKHGEKGNLEHIVEALRQTYTSDSEMVEDMDSRYGPEPTEIDAELLLQSSIDRMESHAQRWREIREDVDSEMLSSPHAFQNVIRTLSVMRIFIEGSQGQSYGIDFTDRQRREAAQQAVLAKLRANRALFIDQCSSPSRNNNSKKQQRQSAFDESEEDYLLGKSALSAASSASTSHQVSNKAR